MLPSPTYRYLFDSLLTLKCSAAAVTMFWVRICEVVYRTVLGTTFCYARYCVMVEQ